ncbi:uncharacterized protein LOC117600494 [Osmia lignaria lignaria]|uniref:uncharacterized protein LOC117600494 n=1 Tax=Osmia lignaria lignaria TaxID=1437193 RepID=UPI00402B0B54
MMTNEPEVVQADLDRLSDYNLQLNRWLLKPIGVWPGSSSTSKIERILSLVLKVICYCFIIFTLVPGLAYLILEPQDFRSKIKIVGPMSHWFAGCISYTALLLRSKDIRYCVNNIEADWRSVTKSKVQQVMLKNAKFGHSVAAFCAIFMHGGVLCHCVVMAFTMESVEVGNETRTIHKLPCVAYTKMIPVDTSPTNEIVLVVQFISSFIVNSTAVGAFSLAIVFASHAYGQLDVLMMWITEFVNESEELDKNVERNEIRVIVKNHVKILSMISRIEHIMSPICLLELCQCTLAMCLLCYFILTEWEGRDVQNLVTYVVVLFSVTFNVFIMCYIGEKLSEQCNRIADAVYSTKWYYLPYKNVLDLVLIIARSSVVTKITAGKVVYMSVYTFGDVIKTAFTYINLLRQTI